MTTVQISFALRTFSAEDPGGWEHLSDQALLLERHGVDRLVVGEHIAYGPNMAEYSRPEVGGQAGGRQPTGPDGHWLEPLTFLTFIAARTTRVRIGTNILIAGLRPAGLLAKIAATLDVLSGGRLDLGVGVGWQREEYDLVGGDFLARGRTLDETLEVCQLLWREPVASYAGNRLSFSGIHQMPKPVQPGGIPIWVSGTVNPRTVQRLIRFGRGWIPWGDAMTDPASGIPRMRDAVAAAGGETNFGVVGLLALVRKADGSPDAEATAAKAAAQVRAGVTDLRLPPSLVEQPDFEELVSALVSKIRAAVSSI